VKHFIGLETLDTRYVDGTDILLVSPRFGFVTAEGREIVIRPVRPQAGGALHGFLTDGGTIPRLAWALVGHPFGRYLPAFLIHDYEWSFRTVSFAETNRTLGQALHALGCPWLKRRTIVRAVSLFGGGIWRRGAAHDHDLAFHSGEIK